MCGRFVSARKRLELLEQFAATRDSVASDRDPDYNVAPTKRIYTVLERADLPDKPDKSDKTDRAAAEDSARPIQSRSSSAAHSGGAGGRPPGRELRLVRWGLVPSWAKDTKGGARMINARSETVAVKPSFRAAFARRRCLIPADGYYEWMTEGKAKQPFYIHRSDGGLLAFAGIYELWRNDQVPEDHEDAWYWSGSIITTEATDEIGRIHDRTPMVIAQENWDDWLNPASRDKDLLLATMRPATQTGLTSYAVSTAVNSVRNNGPSLIEPLGEADAPGLSVT
jgi:putative SOS response-associated peptidase YedK